MGCLTLTSLACDVNVSERVYCICAIPNFFSGLRAGRASKEHPLSCLRGFLETTKRKPSMTWLTPFGVAVLYSQMAMNRGT